MGNPNTGKTSIFNFLTGLQQKVGNYPGITVEKKEGVCRLLPNLHANIIDLPGTYSLSPTSLDEQVAVKELLRRKDNHMVDVVVVVCEVENLKRNLLLFSQIKDLELPVIVVINMSDRMKSEGISIDVPALQRCLSTQVILTSTRNKTGFEALKQAICAYEELSLKTFLPSDVIQNIFFSNEGVNHAQTRSYSEWLQGSLDNEKWSGAKEVAHIKRQEAIRRYQYINASLKGVYEKDALKGKGLRATLDRILIHPFWGYIIFAVMMLIIFQSIFSWSSIPMEAIDRFFTFLAGVCSERLPQGMFTSLLTEGILPGIGGVVVFVPQIAFLFLFMSILEETGYMSRVVFLSDRWMRPLGLSGKSVVPLISGAACAIPAIMISRNIFSWKERLITILVTPFITCSARLPVYLIITELVIPDGTFLCFSYKTWVILGLYASGFIMALLSAFVLHRLLKAPYKSASFVVEMPNYSFPLLRNVILNVYEKVKGFVFGAGKIILAISVILWFLGSHGMGERYDNAENYAREMADQNHWDVQTTKNYLEAYKLEHSYLGNIGKAIQPIFSPLGYDWKISIGILTSFAAREVFVGTLASIYRLGNDIDWEDSGEGRNILIHKMRAEKDINGTPVFTLATGVSLLLFYAFAMQCLSTLAIVRKETNSWKWPLIQWFVMTSFAYVVSLTAFQCLK